jgi:hypothetical protein
MVYGPAVTARLPGSHAADTKVAAIDPQHLSAAIVPGSTNKSRHRDSLSCSLWRMRLSR